MVFSSTLQEPWTEQTEPEPALTRDAVERAKSAGNATIGRPALAKSALEMGLVDAVSPVIYPVIVVGGTAVRLDYAVQ